MKLFLVRTRGGDMLLDAATPRPDVRWVDTRARTPRLEMLLSAPCTAGRQHS